MKSSTVLVGLLIILALGSIVLGAFIYTAIGADPVSVYESDTPIVQLLEQYAGSELLGRPTDKSVAINIIAPAGMAAFVEYGNASGKYTHQSAIFVSVNGEPIEITLTDLSSNTRYYYKTHYELSGEVAFRSNSEHSFITQRPVGSTFTFDLQADPHMDGNSDPSVYRKTLQNESNDQPDFLIDLGDTFMTEKFALTQEQVERRYLETRAFFDIAGGSAPVFLVNGNHDGEFGWVFNAANKDNDAYWAINARKLYYPNPYPDGFYTGSSTQDPMVGLHENYFAWTWGNALFVVIDPYTYSNDLKKSANNWDSTIGDQQYQWFKQTLEQSNATYKFVFEHHMLGEYRGMTSWVNRFEWGGYNNQSIWQFDQMRSNWALPMHQLMVQNNVTIFFQGHDHFYCKESKDGIIYQEVPQPSCLDRASNPDSTIASQYLGQAIGSSGYMRVRVSPQNVSAEYIRTSPVALAGVADSYSIQSNMASTTPTPTETPVVPEVPVVWLLVFFIVMATLFCVALKRKEFYRN